jgi:hypothetical protein
MRPLTRLLLFSTLIALELPMTVVQTVMRLFGSSCIARARAGRAAACAGVETENNAVIIAPLKRMIVTALISLAPFFRGARLEYSKNFFGVMRCRLTVACSQNPPCFAKMQCLTVMEPSIRDFR